MDFKKEVDLGITADKTPSCEEKSLPTAACTLSRDSSQFFLEIHEYPQRLHAELASLN